MVDLMDNYTKGSEFIGKIILKPNSPHLNKLLERIYDDWNNQDKNYNRWNIMKRWVDYFKSGASFEEMIYCKEADDYIKWWLYTANNNNITVTQDDIELRRKDIVDMIFSISKDGYNEEKLKNDRNDFVPIKVSIDSLGTIHTFDGAHRTMILAALGMDIPSNIHFIHEDFLKIVTSLSMLYQPSSHPCIQHLRVIRKDNIRYEVIRDKIIELGIKLACEIGCAEGEGLFILNQSGAEVTGVENEINRLIISKSLCKVTGIGKAIKYIDNTKYEAFIGLSVWHHLAEDLKTLNKWINLTKHSDYQFVEMPEYGSKTFKQQLIDDTGWNWENVGEELTNYIMLKGGYTKSEILYIDKKYANRKTILLSREKIENENEI